MKIQHLIRTIIAIGLISTPIVSSRNANAKSQPKTFLEWCQNRNTIAQDAKVTVDLLLEVARTTDCQRADKTLKVGDIRTLSNLSNLTSLSLEGNDIVNLQPLSNLKNLKEVY